MTRRILSAAAVLLLLLPGLAAADGPVNLSLFAPIQIVDENESVGALRVSLIYGKNVDMTGLDISLVGHNTGSVTGVSLVWLGMADGDFTGWQNGWLAGIANGNMQGLQTGIYTHSGMGSTGVQVGFLNTSDDFSGLQLGLVNIAETMRSGLQIGLVNIIKSKEKLKFFPIVNWSF